MIYMRIIFASIALFAVIYMIKFLNTQGIQQVPAANVLLETSSYPNHIPLVPSSEPNAWTKTSLDWCKNRQTELHYFQSPKNDLWSITETDSQWTLQQGQGKVKMDSVSMEKWLATNCQVLAYRLNAGFKFANLTVLPFHLKVVYVGKKEALFNTDDNGIFEKDGQLYYSLEFATALKALAQSASVNR